VKINDVQDFFSTLQGLDPQNIGSWPLAAKVFVYVIVFVVVLLLGYGVDLKGMQDLLANGEQKQQNLMSEFEAKVFKAENLETYRQQLKDMEDSFGALLRQLPQDTEVPGLLEDIDHVGVGSGLTVQSVDLGTEAAKDFYAEQPINIKVQGDYHAFGAFVSGVSALPRIVTLHDFAINPVASRFKDDGAPVLVMTIQAKTYRYTEKGDDKGKKGGKSGDTAAAGGKK
jgi:type IV pilus assembly protein PilO